jgi:Electron transfer DM13
MKFIQTSILGLACLLLVSCSTAGTSTQTSANLAIASSPKTLTEGTTEINHSTRLGQLTAATLRSGSFVRGEHPTRGGASIVNVKGRAFLQLNSSFKTSNQGPDLVVVLHRSRNVLGAAKPPNYALKGSGYVVLAPLRKSQGAQRYAIPDGINLEDYHSAVIWCRKFNATFGVARLG